MFDRHHHHEIRRRIVRWAMQPLFEASDRRLRHSKDLLGTEVRRILVCRPNHRLGNLLLLTPLIAELERVFPNAEVDVVLAGDEGELFRAFRNVKHVYSLSRRMVRHPIATLRIARQIRRAKYDLAIDPCQASQSGRLLVAWANAKYVVGVPRSGAPADPETVAVMRCAPPHMAQWPVYLLRNVFGRKSSGMNHGIPALDVRLAPAERHRARTLLDNLLNVEGKPLPSVIIGVFAEATGAKRYSPEWWHRFIREVQSHHPDYAILEIAPPDGRPRLATGFPCFSSPSPRGVAAMISNMTCFVSADCGVMHLASASGTPTVGLFSVTDALKYEPYGHGSRAFITNGKSPEDIAHLVSAVIAGFNKRAPLASNS